MKLKPKSTTKNPKALIYRRFIGLEKSENLQTIYNTADGKFWTFDVIEKKFTEISIDKVPQGSKVVNVALFSTVLSYQSFYFKYDGTKWLQTSTDGTSFENNFSITVNTLPYGEAEYTDTNYTPMLKNRLKPDGYNVDAYHFNITTPGNITYTLTIYARNLYTGEEYVLFDFTHSTRNVDFEVIRSWLYVRVDSIITKIYFKAENNTSISRDIRIYCGIEDGAIFTNNIELLSGTFNNIAKYQTNKYYYIGNFDFTIKGSIEGTTAQYIKGNIIPLTSLNIKYFDDEINLRTDDLVVVDGHLYSVENPETTIKQQPKPFKIHFATLNSIL
jgi:hypothetical protein